MQEQTIEMAASEHESLNDALIECVKACGGSKVVGIELWPAKGMEAAQRYLLGCLNPDRPEKLGPDEVLHVIRMARERGCHVGMQYIAAFLSYSMPTPVEPRDEADELRRQVLAIGQQLQTALASLARIEQTEKPKASQLRTAA
jgi:hypothetical protein